MHCNKSIWWFTSASPIDRYCESAITFSHHKRAAITNQSTFFTCCSCTSAHFGGLILSSCWRRRGYPRSNSSVCRRAKDKHSVKLRHSIWTSQFFCFIQFLVAEGTMLLGYSIFQLFVTHSQINLNTYRTTLFHKESIQSTIFFDLDQNDSKQC